jgi:hypothetical protein
MLATVAGAKTMLVLLHVDDSVLLSCSVRLSDVAQSLNVL